jgi:RNA polymerase sigma factor (sigma-70 family)
MGWKYAYAPAASHLDLIQEAIVGLSRAIELFDPFRGAAFSTYAVQWVRQAADRHHKDSRFVVRLPVHLHERLNDFLERWEDVRRSREWSVHAPDPELANPNDAERPDAILAARALAVADPVSWEELRRIEEDTVADSSVGHDQWKRFMQDSPTDLVEDVDRLGSLASDVATVLGYLHPRTAEVLSRRFGGLGGAEPSQPQTLQEIGDSLGLTRERIRQIEAKGLKALRQSKDAAAFRSRWAPERSGSEIGRDPK